MGQLKMGGAERQGSAAGAALEIDEQAAAGSIRLGTYLRKLREGYGYTLRKVEERAMALGEAIDNSQLSRFEKGKAVPSFDKLRALARVFNVPVQNFSDVLDLEEYQHLKPEAGEYAGLLAQGAEFLARGENGRAYVTYERALEVAQDEADSDKSAELVAEARWRMACALKALGKLYMTERELRELLKLCHQLQPRTRLRTLLQLSYLYRELGDLYLASVLAKECLELSRQEQDTQTEAGVLNTLANIEHDRGQPDKAVELYRDALAVLTDLVGQHEMKTMVMTNLGGCLAAVGSYDQGVAMLHEAYGAATQAGFRRVAALALTRLAEAMIERQEFVQARRKLAESDALASRPESSYHDILFLNTYHRWTLARREGNGTGEKIAFGRLRHLRSLLQRRFAEVDEFDRHVEKIRR